MYGGRWPCGLAILQTLLAPVRTARDDALYGLESSYQEVAANRTLYSPAGSSSRWHASRNRRVIQRQTRVGPDRSQTLTPVLKCAFPPAIQLRSTLHSLLLRKSVLQKALPDALSSAASREEGWVS